MDSRDKKIDIAKGISMILVEFSHLGMGKWAFIINGFFIPIFFILSGYTYNNSKAPDQKTILSKSKRLLKPYVFFNLVYLIYYYIAHNFQFDSINQFIGIFYSRFCLYTYGTNDNIYYLSMEGNAPNWFLTAMFVAYISFYLLIKNYNKNNNLGYIILASYLFFSIILNKLPILLPWSIDNAFLFSITPMEYR